MSVQLDNRGHWEWFSIKVFYSKHCFNLGFCVNNDYKARSVRLCVEGYPSHLFLDAFFKLESVY